MKKFFITLLFLFPLNLFALSPSFDCNSKLNEIEKTICNIEKLIKIDIEMNQLFSKAKKTKGIKEDQKKWFVIRNNSLPF